MPVRDGLQAGPGPVSIAQVPLSPDQLQDPTLVRRLSGLLLPGLLDAHVHLGLIDPYLLAAGGISAVDDLGGIASQLSDLERRSIDPAAGLPRIRFAGAFLTCPGGYPSDRSWAAAGSWREIHSVADAETAVAEQISASATLIKVALNSTAGPVLPAPVLAAVVTAAHQASRTVTAHAEGPGMAEAALAAGADRFAHTPWTELLDDGALRMAADQQSGWISTLALHDEPGRQIALGNLRRFLEHGGQVVYGTDQGNGPQPTGVNPAEIRALQAAGLSVDDILTAMTSAAAGPPNQSWQARRPCHIPASGDSGPRPLDAGVFAQTLDRAQVVPDQEGPR